MRTSRFSDWKHSKARKIRGRPSMTSTAVTAFPSRASRAHPSYTRDLTGKGLPDIIMGQYSGGEHCCTVATILELGKDAVTPIGRIDGIDGMPFEGLEVRKLIKGADWQCIAHRPIMTSLWKSL